MTNLQHLLTDPDRDIRLDAAIALGAETDDAAVPALVARLGTETDCKVREAITWACAQHGEAARPLVVDRLDDAEASVREQAAHTLSKIGGDGIAEHLAGVIADEDPLVAIKGFRAASSTGDPSVVPALAARLGDGDAELRNALCTAFANLGEAGVPALVEALGSEDLEVRSHAVDALAIIGTPDADAAAGPLADLLDDADAELRLSAVSALGELGDAAAADGLARAATSSDERVSAVAKVLQARAPRQQSALQRALRAR